MTTKVIDQTDPTQWDPKLDAVIAAPGNHKVLFENDRLRVLEVILKPDEEEPTHHHRWPSVFVFDEVEGPIHDFAPDGTMMPPNRDVIQARSGMGRSRLSRGAYGPPTSGSRAQRFEQDPAWYPCRDEVIKQT